MLSAFIGGVLGSLLAFFALKLLEAHRR